ncbi:hypothetical protein GPALN_016290 [Globodera pallida]|nr:hypothetical protein GPALN_016290 [Globodera pallida]
MNFFPSSAVCCFFFLGFFASLHPTTSRRLCGQVLTSELKRVCTKEGMKGPCLHGASNFAPVQTKRASEKRFPPLWRRLPKWAALSTTLPLFFPQVVADNSRTAVFGRHFAWLSTTIDDKFLQNFHRIQRRNDNAPGAVQQIRSLRLKRAKGIVDKCCSGDGCDDSFLDSFCCDEAEEKVFRANHKI